MARCVERDWRMSYESTSVPVSRSQEQLKKLVLNRGGGGIAFVSQPPHEGFEAQIPIEGKIYRIRITAEVKAEPKSAHRYRGNYIPATDGVEAAERKVWRVIFWHLKSIYDTAETGVMEFREMILPYIVTADGKTVAQHIVPKLASAISGRPDRLLPAAQDTKGAT